MPTDRSARVVVASAQPLFLDGLALVLGREADIQVVASSGLDESLPRTIRQGQPDLAILDLDLNREDAVTAIRAIHAVAPSTKLVLFTSPVDDDVLATVVRLGVRAVLSKSVAASVFAACVRHVHIGGYWLETPTAPSAPPRTGRRAPPRRDLAPERLTARERQVAELAGQGVSAAGIGRRLNISAATVKVHLRHVYGKLRIADRAALVLYTRDRGLRPGVAAVRPASSGQSRARRATGRDARTG